MATQLGRKAKNRKNRITSQRLDEKVAQAVDGFHWLGAPLGHCGIVIGQAVTDDDDGTTVKSRVGGLRGFCRGL